MTASRLDRTVLSLAKGNYKCSVLCCLLEILERLLLKEKKNLFKFRCVFELCLSPPPSSKLVRDGIPRNACSAAAFLLLPRSERGAISHAAQIV